MLNIDLSMVEKEEQYIIGRVTNDQAIRIAGFFALQVLGPWPLRRFGNSFGHSRISVRSRRSQIVRRTDSRLSMV